MVVDGAPCAVAIAPRGLAERGPLLRRILVGCDGSKDAAALETAAALAERVCTPHPGRSGGDELRPRLPKPARATETARIEQALVRARESLPRGLTMDTVKIHGVASDVIVGLGHEADLLVLGSRGRYDRLRRLFLGSVAARVAHAAPCPTLIVP